MSGTHIYLSSPFIRTLQTCAYFGYGFSGGNTKCQIHANNNIVVKLNGGSKGVFKSGVLASCGPEATISTFMDSLCEKITPHDSTYWQELYTPDGSYTENSCNDRYLKGFQDIIQKGKDKQVIFAFSHSDGI